MKLILITAVFITVHNIDGEAIHINPDHIVTLHPTHEDRGKPNTLVTRGVQCVIAFSSAKFISVVEDCDDIRKMMENKK